MFTSTRRSTRALALLLAVCLAAVMMAGCSSGASSGSQVAVPDVKNKSQAEAVDLLTKAGLVGQVQDQAGSAESTGVVSKQAPEAGTQVAKGSTVIIILGGEQGGSTVPVPDVVGQLQGEAAKEVGAAGLIFQALPAYDDKVAAGKVISQDPAAGTQGKQGSTVTAKVSLGQKTTSVTVPRVVNWRQSVASAALKNMGLAVREVKDTGSYAPAGQVVWQKPNAGVKVKAGTVIVLSVSTGHPLVEVPSVVGLSSGTAKARLGRARLGYSIIDRRSSTVPSGKVISQSVIAGRSVPSGTTITLHVSSGPASVQVPSVVGLSSGAAEAALGMAGFGVSTSTMHSSSVQRDFVISQSPSGGSHHQKGTTVGIVISSGPSPDPNVTMPNVVGVTMSAASEELRDMGFGVKIVYRDSTQVPADQVLAQTPAAGIRVPKGTEVQLFVARGGLPQ